MAEFDTIIRNGLVVDGTGGASYYADIGITEGKIAAIGKLRHKSAASEIDAQGKIVAPGHVTQHAHYDAMLFWNPYLSNSGENGVTTVVNANCGFGFAPVRSKDKERLMMMMETTEQIPVKHQKAAMPWNWESFPDFLAVTRALPKGVNVATYMPLNPLMVYVMGIDGAKSRRPTADEILEMQRLIQEGLEAGALGVSISIMGAEGNSHVDYDGSVMPTDALHDDDVVEIARAVANHGSGIVQLLSKIGPYGNPHISERIAEICKGTGARVIHNILSTQEADEDMSWLTALRSRGLDITGQALAYRGWIEQTLHDLTNSLGQLPTVRQLVACKSDPDIMKLISDEDFVARFEAEVGGADATSGASGLEPQIIIEMGPDASLQEFLGLSLAEAAAVLGLSVPRTLLELGRRSALAITIKTLPIAVNDPSIPAKMMGHSAVTFGVSDGGAHTKNHSLGHYATDLIIWLVRESGVTTLEDIHFQLALKAAQTLNIRDRGAIMPGFWADLIVYDLEELFVDQTRMEIVHDMPGGDWRRRVKAGGYDSILVNGIVTHKSGVPTGDVPGQFLSMTL